MEQQDEDKDIKIPEEEVKEVKKASSMKGMLEGSLLAEKLRSNIRFVLFATFLGIWYITNGYSTEKLHRERGELEKEVTDLRFESITTAADLMFMRKQSEVLKRIHREGLTLEESKEPPVKLYRR
ncbi:MAG: FtsL-like putative cell division protein [Odoribacter sp.]